MEGVFYSSIFFKRPNRVWDSMYYSSGINRLIKKGILKRLPCEICDNEKAHAHHEVYDVTNYEIRWLCRKHHREIHYLLKQKYHGIDLRPMKKEQKRENLHHDYRTDKSFIKLLNSIQL